MRVMPDVRVREATADDLPTLARMMAESALLRRYATEYAPALAALSQGRDEGDLLLVLADAEDVPRGMVWVIYTRAFDHGAYVRLLLVAARNVGGGTRLMQEVERRTHGRAKHLYLLVTRDNMGARRFYERLGMRPVGDLPALVRPELDEVLYYKRLSRS